MGCASLHASSCEAANFLEPDYFYVSTTLGPGPRACLLAAAVEGVGRVSAQQAHPASSLSHRTGGEHEKGHAMREETRPTRCDAGRL